MPTLHAQVADDARLVRAAAGIAHDFNNLLTAISGYAELIRHDEAPASVRYELAEQIVLAAREGQVLTRQLQALSTDARAK